MKLSHTANLRLAYPMQHISSPTGLDGYEESPHANGQIQRLVSAGRQQNRHGEQGQVDYIEDLERPELCDRSAPHEIDHLPDWRKRVRLSLLSSLLHEQRHGPRLALRQLSGHPFR